MTGHDMTRHVVQKLPKKDAKNHPEPLKLAAPGLNMAISASLIISWQIFLSNWRQLHSSWRKSWCEFANFGSIFSLTSASGSHFGPSSRQWSILGLVWQHFGTGLGPFVEDFGINVELFLLVLLLCW